MACTRWKKAGESAPPGGSVVCAMGWVASQGSRRSWSTSWLMWLPVMAVASTPLEVKKKKRLSDRYGSRYAIQKHPLVTVAGQV